MCTATPQDLAEVGYRAYGDWAEWTNHAGNPMPSWAELPEPQRLAWEAAVNGIRDALLNTARGESCSGSAYAASHPGGGGPPFNMSADPAACRCAGRCRAPGCQA